MTFFTTELQQAEPEHQVWRLLGPTTQVTSNVGGQASCHLNDPLGPVLWSRLTQPVLAMGRAAPTRLGAPITTEAFSVIISYREEEVD